jgi:quercetin dioxygenase-like cupin family protein
MGDRAVIPAGEKHWHGAADGFRLFSHFAQLPDSNNEVFG